VADGVFTGKKGKGGAGGTGVVPSLFGIYHFLKAWSILEREYLESLVSKINRPSTM
jgi:hypothetical protein